MGPHRVQRTPRRHLTPGRRLHTEFWRPDRALRSLVYHATNHLDVGWRDLNSAQWETPLTLSDGKQISTRKTPRLRALEIRQHAVDLGSGGRATDMPADLRNT